MRGIACLPEKAHRSRPALDGVAVIIAISKMRRVDEDPTGCEPVGTVIRPVPVQIAIGAIGIAPVCRIDFSSGQEFAIRWHGKPANVIVAATPQHPRGRPDVTGDPQPTVSRIIDPAAIMEGNVAPAVVRNPDPAVLIRIIPMPLPIGPEIGHRRAPDISPAGVMEPAAIRP